uniref:Reverse transcriptase zinc-binding domain-containing protein n=1 Tax=Rhodnius prolixus TaxID=13249 RepID=T1HRC9_RHOPR
MADQLPRQPWFKGTVTNKWVVRTISRLRANHAVCGSYLHRINKKVLSSICVDCNEEEEFKHIVMICPRYVVERKRMFDDIYRYLDAQFRYEDKIFSTNIYVLKSVAELAMKCECI